MADAITFNLGKDWEWGHVLTGATVYCALSHLTIQTGQLDVYTTMAGGIGEVAGLNRATVVLPASTNGIAAVPTARWPTAFGTLVNTVVVTTATDNTGTAVAAQHIAPGGSAVTLNTGLDFALTYWYANVGES